MPNDPARPALAELPLALFLPSLFSPPNAASHPGSLLGKLTKPSPAKPNPLKRGHESPQATPSKRRMLEPGVSAVVGRRLFPDAHSVSLPSSATTTPLPSSRALAPSPEIHPRSVPSSASTIAPPTPVPFIPIPEEDKENHPPPRRRALLHTVSAPNVTKPFTSTPRAAFPLAAMEKKVATPREDARRAMLREVDARDEDGEGDDDDDEVEEEI